MVHSIAAWVLVAVALATAPAPVGAQSLCANSLAYQPGNTFPNNGNSSSTFTCAQYSTNVLGAVPFISANCDTPVGSGPQANTLRYLVWYGASVCCSDFVPNSVCGVYRTGCNTSALLLNTSVIGGGTTCATTTADLMGQFADAGNNCSATTRDSTFRDSISSLAQNCCTGGVAGKNWACGPPPVSGSFCANPADFTPATFQPMFNTSCANVQNFMLTANVYASNATCTELLPNSGGGLTWGGALSVASRTCCGGNSPSSTCAGGRVSPCEDPADFMPSAIVDFGQGETQPCSNVEPAFFGLNASGCSRPLSEGDGGTASQMLSIVGRTCCSGSRLNLLCGSPAPTPPPTVAPPRAGPTYPCGGSFQAWRTSTTGGATCAGVPFINQTLVGGVCGSYNDTDRGTEFGFALSNGGMCLGFNTSQRCQDAVGNLSSIRSTAPADQYVSFGDDGAGQCFLRQSSCARYDNLGAAVIITPQCGAAPNPTPGSMCANPAHFTPAAPIRDTSGATCATMQAAFVAADLYGFSSLCDVVPDADGFTWGAKFASTAWQCCTGPIANTCSARRLLPCQSVSDFQPFNNVSFSPGEDGAHCATVALALYGATAASCSLPAVGSTDGQFAQVMALVGRNCCTGGRQNLVCGSLAPTPPPTARPPRVGATIPCAGAFQAYYLTSPGGATCAGTPFLNVSLAAVCSSFVSSGGDTEYGFTISTGGVCAAFNNSVDCTNAANNLASIISGTPVDQYTSGRSGQCFLGANSCTLYSDQLLAAIVTPACGGAPTSSPITVPPVSPAPTLAPSPPTSTSPTLAPSPPTSTSPTPSASPTTGTPTPVSPAPTFAPTLSPATLTSSTSSGSGSVISNTVAIIIVAVVALVIVIGIFVYGHRRNVAIVKKRNVMNPTYEEYGP
jgi:hypothetical protein